MAYHSLATNYKAKFVIILIAGIIGLPITCFLKIPVLLVILVIFVLVSTALEIAFGAYLGLDWLLDHTIRKWYLEHLQKQARIRIRKDFEKNLKKKLDEYFRQLKDGNED